MPSFFDDEVSCDVVPLITCVDGRYAVDADTLSWIQAKSGGFSVVACAGRYRTGKSFLLNRLARADAGTGFGVGDTVQACTKGLWVYKKWISTDDPNRDILFMDTEGIDALDADDTHDVRVFTLALLLSSVFLYNSVGPIDETSMQTLSLMTRVTENVKLHSRSEDTNLGEIAKHMPAFFWVLRDFSFALVDKESNPLTPDAYLEYALQTGDSNKDQVRGAIRGAFSTRHLVTLPRPSKDVSMSDLEHRLRGVTPKFNKAVDALRQSLFAAARPFSAHGEVVSGRMYGALCTHLAGLVETGSVPVMQDSWSLMAAVHARDLKEECLKEFEQRLATKTPQRAAAIDALLAALVNEAVARFDRDAMQPVDSDVRAVLQSALKDRAAAARPDLVRDSGEEARRLLADLHSVAAANPHRVHEFVGDASQRFFGDDARDDESELVWAAETSRELLKALPAAVHAHQEVAEAARHDAKVARDDAKVARDECESLLTQLEDAQQLPCMTDVRERELLQLCEARDAMCVASSLLVDRMQQELASLRTELHADELIFSSYERAVAEPECEEAGEARAPEQEEDLHVARLRVVELETLLQQERQQLEETARHVVDLKERLQKTCSVHAELETSWNQGLERLKEDERVRRAQTEERLRKADCDQSASKDRQDAAESEIAGLRREAAEMARRLVCVKESYEREKKQLGDAAQQHREQCEAAQRRVLEIHQSMLDDLRIRDERTREVQTLHHNDRLEQQTRLTDMQHTHARTVETLEKTKRRLHELQPAEIEVKRLKTTQQSDSLVLVRLQTEVEQVQRVNAKLTTERDTLRQDNMRMEGELALLRAEKQLHDARIALDVP
jgi:hypothetical protein